MKKRLITVAILAVTVSILVLTNIIEKYTHNVPFAVFASLLIHAGVIMIGFATVFAFFVIVNLFVFKPAKLIYKLIKKLL